jgi:hypothetical protein
VVKPRSAVTPSPDRKTWAPRSPVSAASAIGPTAAPIDRRSAPPISTTSICGASMSAPVTEIELVTTVR